MSKMPAKKKSCFQITSVTQAQVAASSITDDAESLDDPDESRTEDASSEIFDVSRTDLGVCDRSSSEENLNNAVEAQDQGHGPATTPVNGGFSYKGFPVGRATPQNGITRPLNNPAMVNSTAPAATVTTSVAYTAPVSTSCSSRFRVIKLDHGTGEPFRRGRWTCTEFYERDSDSNVNRTVDSIRPSATPDHCIDRDSGLGTTSSSVVTSCAFSAQESSIDGGYSGHVTHPHPSDHQHQGYVLSPQIGNGVSAFHPIGYAPTASQQPPQAQAPQNTLSNIINCVHQGAIQQKSPIMPPAAQPQQIAYTNHPAGLTAGQLDYRQQHFGASPQNLPPTNLPVVPPISQVASSLSNAAALAALHPGSGLQQAVSQSLPSGRMGSASPSPSIATAATSNSHSSPQNAPAIVPTATPPGVQPPGTLGGVVTGLPSGFINQVDDGGPNSDAPTQLSAVVVAGKDAVKPSISETLSLATPAVNSLFGIHITMDGNVDEDSASGASVVAIDNKIEQAMDLVKSHLMYAVREEVEVLKEQIKELYERNSVLERENAVLKSLANTDQLSQLPGQPAPGGGSGGNNVQQQQQQQHNVSNSNNNGHDEAHGVPHQPNANSA